MEEITSERMKVCCHPQCFRRLFRLVPTIADPSSLAAEFFESRSGALAPFSDSFSSHHFATFSANP